MDAYVTKLSTDGQNVIYSTFLGGSGFEYGWDIAVDSAGSAYMTGFTQSSDFPTAHALQPTTHGNTDAFVAKINPSGNAFVFSTYLGGSNTDQGTSIAADSIGNAYVGGYTKSTNFPTANAIQPSNHGGWDAFVAKISGDGSALMYSTYLGGTANESIVDAGYRDLGIAVDSAGSAYVAGTTKSADFPTTPLAFQKALKGGADAFVAKIATGGSPTTMASSLNPSTYGQKVTWTATVTSSGSVRPTGKVQFRWSIYSIGSATLDSGGVATLTRSKLSAGTYPLTAVYLGDAANSPSTSVVLNQVVLQATSSATLTSSLNPSTQGQAVNFTATISSPTVRPTGPVTFMAGKTVLGTAQLKAGKATLTISSLALGSTRVTATYYGNSNISKSSASVIQTVQ